MKIHSIASNVYFGYNKALNEKVNKKLENAKGNKELSQTLLNMNKLCMSMEDNLRNAEKANNTRLVDIYSTLLFELKPITTEQLNNRFPLLKYRETELNGYKEEIKERKLGNSLHWLNGISEDLMSDEEFEQSVIPKYKELAESQGNSQTSGIDKTTDKKQTETVTPTKKSSVKKKNPCEYLEEFVPNEFTPKGFDSLGGMDKIKESLTDKVIFPIKNPEIAKLDEIEYGKKAPRGILLYGPPGCGKTAITQALAMESGVPMYNLKISKAGSPYVNGSAINIQAAYEYLVEKAKDTGKPVIMLMDEMESIASKRKGGESGGEDNKVVSTLLPIFEEARSKNVILICATNCYDQLDEAIKSRLEDKDYIGLPDDETRASVLKILLNRRTKGQALAANDEELNKVVKLTKGFSNRDLTILTDKAALIARNDNRREITADDFITPVRDNQNMKIKENLYQAKQTRTAIGYTK